MSRCCAAVASPSITGVADLDDATLASGLRHALQSEVVTRARSFGRAVAADRGAAARGADLIERRA